MFFCMFITYKTLQSCFICIKQGVLYAKHICFLIFSFLYLSLLVMLIALVNLSKGFLIVFESFYFL